jgi:hypothetical protein
MSQVYISRDVIFKENVFTFANLNSSAGAKYTSKVSLLRDHSISPGTSDLHVDHSPTASDLPVSNLWPYQLLQPQIIRRTGTDPAQSSHTSPSSGFPSSSSAINCATPGASTTSTRGAVSATA